jgi:hypothetical protein
VFARLRDRLRKGEDINVHEEFRTIEPNADDPWMDAAVRGQGFGRARVVSLDALMFAIREVSDHKFEARDR